MSKSSDSVTASPLRRVFVGPDGLRAGWRILIFHLIAFGLATGLFLAIRFVSPSFVEGAFTVEQLIVMEAIYIGCTLVALAAMARLERRRLADYGIPLRRLFSGRFWIGALWGLAAIAAIALGVAAAGGLRVAGFSASPGLGIAALLWAVGTLGVAVFEELFFRGYFLSALRDGIGFWPAAVSQSLYFGFVLHYLEKENETLIDGVNVSLVALVLCVSVLRSGDVRWATGMHWTFNFTSFFVLGSPNTAFGGPVQPHLLDSSFSGPGWVSGGATGLEASVAATVVFAALLGALLWRGGALAGAGSTGRSESPGRPGH